jgi:hypothetical protein
MQNKAATTARIPNLFGGIQITFAKDTDNDFIAEYLNEITHGETANKLRALGNKIQTRRVSNNRNCPETE